MIKRFIAGLCTAGFLMPAIAQADVAGDVTDIRQTTDNRSGGK